METSSMMTAPTGIRGLTFIPLKTRPAFHGAKFKEAVDGGGFRPRCLLFEAPGRPARGRGQGYSHNPFFPKQGVDEADDGGLARPRPPR